MGRPPLTFTVERPIRAAQAAPSLANVVRFNSRGRRLAKFEPITSTCSSKRVIPLPSAASEGSTSGGCGPKGVIIDFAQADRGGHAAKGVNAGRTRTKLASR
jgi:hypothetical protein